MKFFNNKNRLFVFVVIDKKSESPLFLHSEYIFHLLFLYLYFPVSERMNSNEKNFVSFLNSVIVILSCNNVFFRGVPNNYRLIRNKLC